MSEISAPRVVRGSLEQARYQDPVVPIYRGNPLIEALPKIYTAEEAYQRMTHYPEYHESQRDLANEIRMHLIYNANQIFKPNWVHLELEQRVSRLLRAGYLARNPCIQGCWREINMRIDSLSNIPRLHAAATGFNLVGISGVGKSTAMEAILRLYPQVIVHNTYAEKHFSFVQVVWLKLDCPFDGSIKGLCINFFQELDEILGTNYYQNYGRGGRTSTDELLGYMKRLTALHGIGCLVVDEIQHLSTAKNAGISRMLNFFVQLVNTMGMPVVLVGTYKALPLLTSEFRQARRASGQGDFVWERMKTDEVWQMFIEALWHYQFVRKPTPLTSQIAEALYDASQGITDFAVKAYLLAQMRAIATGIEVITPALIHSVAADSFRFAKDVLDALRANDWQKLKMVPDIQLVDMENHYEKGLAEVNQLSLRKQKTETPEIAQPPQSRQNRSKPDVVLAEDDLRSVAVEKESDGLTPYQVLQQARHIKPISEFLELEEKHS